MNSKTRNPRLGRLVVAVFLILGSFTLLQAATPVCTLAYPTNSGTGTVAGTTVNLKISWNPPWPFNALARVKYFTNGVLFMQRTAAPWTASWAVPLGTYDVDAIAYDVYGAGYRSTTNTLIAVQPETNHTPAAPFTDTPVVATGVLQAEQFDSGGNGVGYYRNQPAPNYLYRNCQLPIANCSDVGQGFCVAKLKSGDWLQYTFEVLGEYDYTFEARVSHETAGASGGVIAYELVDGNGQLLRTLASNVTLPALDGWQNIESAGLHLSAGIHHLRVRMIQNASDNYVGKLNYISVFPTVPTNTFPGTTIALNPGSNQGYGWLVPNDSSFAVAQSNSWAIQAAVDAILASPAGGTVQLPAGTYFLAQGIPLETLYEVDRAASIPFHSPPYEGNGFRDEQTYAVRLTKLANIGGQWDSQGSNIRILGAAIGGETILKAHNRSVTLFAASRVRDYSGAVEFNEYLPQSADYRNITFERLVLSGRPHTQYDPQYSSGKLENGQFLPMYSGSQCAYGGSGALLSIQGSFAVGGGRFVRNLNILNCKFINAAHHAVILGGVDGALISGNSFAFHTIEVPDGNMSGTPNDSTCPTTSATDYVWTGIFGTANNIVIRDNYFDGYARDTKCVLEPGSLDGIVWTNNAADGLVWLQGGGNIMIMSNIIRSYDVEAVQVWSGPTAVVRNNFQTSVKAPATTALHATHGTGAVGLTGQAKDFVFTFANNNVNGGRNGVVSLNPAHETYWLHISDNYVALRPPPLNTWWNEEPGSFAQLSLAAGVSVLGNTVSNAGYGIWLRSNTRNVTVRNNSMKDLSNGGIFDLEPCDRGRIDVSWNDISCGAINPAHIWPPPGSGYTVCCTNAYKDYGHLLFSDGSSAPYYYVYGNRWVGGSAGQPHNRTSMVVVPGNAAIHVNP